MCRTVNCSKTRNSLDQVFIRDGWEFLVLCSQSSPGVAFFLSFLSFLKKILEVRGGIVKYILKYFKKNLMFFFKNHWRHRFLWGPLWALLRPSIDPRLHLECPPTRDPYYSICQFVWQGLGLRRCRWVYNLLLLYDRRGQLMKLRVSIVALLI